MRISDWSSDVCSSDLIRKGAAIADAVRDPSRFSSKRILVPDEQNFDVPFFVPLMSDPPDHAGYRALCAPLFTPNRIAELRPSVTELTGQLIDERSEEHTSELQSLMRTSYAVFC